MSRPLVLAVEDEEGIRQLLTAGLPLLGFDVLTAPRGQEGLELFRDRWQDIAAVVLDEVLPDMRGLDVYTEMRETNPAVRVCFVTGWGSVFPGNRVSEFPVLRKPFALAELAEVLRKLTA